jgi:cysteine desulfurase
MEHMFEKRRRMYLDHASATPVHEDALRAMERAGREFANPGSIHADGVAALTALRGARTRIARALAARPREIIFTSGLSESNNLAILGPARSRSLKGEGLAGTHWITTSIEHASVLDCFAEIERLGGDVTHLDPGPDGIVTAELLKRALRPTTVFVSVGWANNEIGTIQPLSELARVIRAFERSSKSKVLFHSDAGQGPLYKVPFVHTLGVDLFSFGSGKLYGPRGIGALYASNRAELAPVILGGGQERGLRAGTEDTVLAAGFAAALDAIGSERAAESRRLKGLRDLLLRELAAAIPGLIVNGKTKESLPHMLNVSFPEVNGEYFVLRLDREGISVATKSACEEGNARSHVVEALGGEAWRAEHAVRFSLGRDTTEKDIKRCVRVIPASWASVARKRGRR